MHEHISGAGAAAVALAGSIEADAAPHVATHYCGYNDAGIRVAVVMPLDDGYAIPGVYASGGSACYGGGLSLVKFLKLENAQRYCEMRNPCVSIEWRAEAVPQREGR